VQVEEINPAWLKRGENNVSFQPTLLEDGLGYSLRDVRLVSVPRGLEPVSTETNKASDGGGGSPLSDGDLGTGLGGPGIHTASLALPADRQPAFLSFYLDKPAGGTLTLTADGGKSRRRGQVRVDLDGRRAGWQAVPIAGVLPAAPAMRLRVQGDRERAAMISEARVVSFPRLSSPADLAVSYPLHGECQDHNTYVRGFVPGFARGKRQLFVDGQLRPTQIDADGSFDANVPEPATVKRQPWSIRLDVDTEGGGHTTRTVPIDTCVDPPQGRVIGVSPPVVDEGAPYGAVVSPHKESTLAFADAKIEIPAGAVETDVRVTMRALDSGQSHPIQAEMDNVLGTGGALRFGPHGLKFKRPVRVTLPVDPDRLPASARASAAAAMGPAASCS